MLGPVLLCSAGAAHCQTSANLSLLSAYTARGAALDTRPVMQLRVEHDGEAGWYAGGFVSPVRFEGRSQAQVIAYGGRAQRVGTRLTWDAGLSRSTFTGASRYNYSEWYAGLAFGRSSARLLYSPAYYGAGRSVYLDLNTAYPLSERWTLAFHTGLLHPFGEYHDATRDGGDLRLALVTSLGKLRLQAGWQTAWHPYDISGARPPALTASASMQF